MKDLFKIFYENDRTAFNGIYERRINFETAKRFNLKVKPMDQPNEFELYYLPTNKEINLVAEIFQISGDLNFNFSTLPSVAKNQFILECIIEELYNTNELEGVKSSREEIARSVRDVKLNKKDRKRFKSMVKSYMKLINGDKFLPRSPADIRAIYDEITQGEIDENELPDGNTFRKDITHIYIKSGTGKIIHRGIHPEDKLVSHMDSLLNFINSENDIPSIIKVAVGHYYFGYIHPFYDGNGRTSRFISSLYLAESLGEISALSLSRGCNKYKTKYLEAFEVTNSLMNRGEMNNFIEAFLNIILKTLREMNLELKEKIELIDLAYNKLVDDPKINDTKKFEFMFILAQNNFFHNNQGITTKELAKEMEVSEVTVRKIAKELLDLSLINQEGKRPAYFKVNVSYFEE